MRLQEAFDQGFDAVKAYVDGALDDFEERLVEVEARIGAVDGKKAVKPKVRVKSSIGAHFETEDAYREWLKDTVG